MKDGASFATAVVIDVQRQAESAAAEWAWIEKHYPGAMPARPRPSSGKNEEAISFAHAMHVYDGKMISALTVQLSDGTERTFYFDISSSFGR